MITNKNKFKREEALKILPDIFKKACRFVEDGHTIKKAIEKAGMSDTTFYKIASPEMKKEILALSKAINITCEGLSASSKELFESDTYDEQNA